MKSWENCWLELQLQVEVFFLTLTQFCCLRNPQLPMRRHLKPRQQSRQRRHKTHLEVSSSG
uniref:Histone H2A.1 n=1 Tax=Solanum tuberosum TaxID=4113 RepID=M1CB04_SOLTU